MDRWVYDIAPSVYLAIVSVIADALSAYALANGLEPTFWRNALRERTVRTLRYSQFRVDFDLVHVAELNQNWLCGQSLYHALLQGYRTGGRTTTLGTLVSSRWLIGSGVMLIAYFSHSVVRDC
jgi:hypothetical protein